MNKSTLLSKLSAITIITFIMSACLNIQQPAPSSVDPPASNFFKYLGFERATYSEVRIWGWSRDGKVAYSDYWSREAAFFRVYIFDFINDTVLWRDSLDLLADPGPYHENYDWFNGKYYLDFVNDFKNVCVQNGIEFIQTEFKELPIRHNNQTVNIILEKEESPLSSVERENLSIFGRYESYKIIAENHGRQKTICEKNFTTVYADDVFLCGYFMSPFENRALIVTGVFAHSFEGSDVRYSFSGCHLSIGFR